MMEAVLQWESLFVETTGPNSKTVINGISGHLAPGKLTAIMGSSGAGKSVLISTLSGRGGNMYRTRGEISINGEVTSQSDRKIVCGVVPQDDVMMPMHTVRENIEFHARFGLPSSTTEEEIQNAVDQVLGVMELKRCKDTKVGLPGVIRGVSGGERKRTAIAMELVSNPVILFLDEPTSGLDSEISLQVLKNLKNVAAQGRTVACTIHQPSSDIMALFDNLILLCDGKIVYFGRAADAAAHFTKLGHPVPVRQNPADHYMKILSKASRKYKASQKKPGSASFESATEEEVQNKSELFKTLCENAPEPPAIGFSFEELKWRSLSEHKKITQGSRLPWYKQLYHLTKRSFQQLTRNGDTFVRIVMLWSVCLICALLFANQDFTSTGIQNRAGVLFGLCLIIGYFPAQSIIVVFPLERPVYLREQAKGLYYSAWYFLAKNISETPLLVINDFLGIVTCYFAIGLRNTATAFFRSFLMYMLIALNAQSIGLLISTGIPDMAKGLELAPVMIVAQSLVAGLFYSVKEIPVYLTWFEKISFLRWGFEGLLQNEFGGLSLKSPSIYAPDAQGDTILEYFGFKLGYGECVAILIGMIIGYRLMSYAALSFWTKRAVVL